MTVANIIKNQNLRNPPICSPDVTVFDAAVEIAALGVNALAVVENGALVGLISDKDIMICIADTGGEFFKQAVDVWMTEKPITCTSGAKLTTALDLMARYAVQNLVVKQGERVITVISSKDILARAHEIDELELKVLRGLFQPIKEASVA